MLPRLATDLTDLLAAAANGGAPADGVRFADDAAVAVVAAAHGYPGAPRTGDPIEGLDRAGSVGGVTVFHAATSRDDTGALRTAGGRVLVVSALGATLGQARRRAYEGVGEIGFDGMGYRRDIGAGIETAPS